MNLEQTEGLDASLLQLACTFETCIPFLPPAGQRNIGKAVAQLRHMAMGYVLAPVEQTAEMAAAYENARGGGQCLMNLTKRQLRRHRMAYFAMLAARPEVKP